jgi:hypothetical protein
MLYGETELMPCYKMLPHPQPVQQGTDKTMYVFRKVSRLELTPFPRNITLMRLRLTHLL